jgi:hypothetical protein
MKTNQRPPYEFTADQNLSLGALSRSVWIVGIGFWVMASVALITLFFEHNPSQWLIMSTFGSALVGFVMGSKALHTRRALKAIIDTQGDDIAHLMHAIEQLNSLFLLYSVMIWSLSLITLLGV